MRCLRRAPGLKSGIFAALSSGISLLVIFIVSDRLPTASSLKSFLIATSFGQNV